MKYKIIFVCHGNICRSVMAEYIFKYYQKDLGVICYSRATSTEEIGNDMYYLAKEVMKKNHIPFSKHSATQITLEDYKEANLVIIMDDHNYYNLKRMISDTSKVHYLKEYSVGSGSIVDPWYSGNFDLAFNEIKEGVLGLIKYLNSKI